MIKIKVKDKDGLHVANAAGIKCDIVTTGMGGYVVHCDEPTWAKAVSTYRNPATVSRTTKARRYDDLYNEGGDGYNPYR